MQIKSMMKYHFTLDEMAVTKKKKKMTIVDIGEAMG